jgi:hypothetical protein
MFTARDLIKSDWANGLCTRHHKVTAHDLQWAGHGHSLTPHASRPQE